LLWSSASFIWRLPSFFTCSCNFNFKSHAKTVVLLPFPSSLFSSNRSERFGKDLAQGVGEIFLFPSYLFSYSSGGGLSLPPFPLLLRHNAGPILFVPFLSSLFPPLSSHRKKTAHQGCFEYVAFRSALSLPPLFLSFWPFLSCTLSLD